MSEFFSGERLVLVLFIGAVACFTAGFCVCALLVMARRSSNDYESK